MRTTAASHRWGRDERGRAGVTGRGREKERREWERWREMKRAGEEGGKTERIKELVGEKGKSGRLSGR